MLVDGVTKLDKVTYGDAAQAETVRKMVVAMARDIRVLVIKLADRLHNARTWRYVSQESAQRKARETLEIYAPLAHRLGMNTIKWELEDLVVRDALPQGLRRDRAPGRRARPSPRGVPRRGPRAGRAPTSRRPRSRPTVTGRPKHYYSVYQKMIVRGRDFEDIYDLVARARPRRLGPRLLRRPRRAARALEPGARPVQGLHRDAEVQHVPVAAHDGDRSRGQAGRDPDPHAHDAPPGRVRRRRALEVQGERHRAGGGARHQRGRRRAQSTTWRGCASCSTGSARPPTRGSSSTRCASRSTPARSTSSRPRARSSPCPPARPRSTSPTRCTPRSGTTASAAGSTAGSCRWSRTLENGDVVEVLTSKADGAGPSRDWLTFVKSPRARNKIRQWFSKERREEAIESGKDAIAKAMRKQGLPLQRLMTHETLTDLAGELRYARHRRPVRRRGRGPRVAPSTSWAGWSASMGGEEGASEDLAEATTPHPARCAAAAATPASWSSARPTCGSSSPAAARRCPATRSSASSPGAAASRCTAPTAPTPSRCSSQPDRLIDVEWAPVRRRASSSSSSRSRRSTATGCCRDVTRVLSDQHVNILSRQRRRPPATGWRSRRFTFEMGDPGHLDHVIKAVRKIDGVFDVYRITGTKTAPSRPEAGVSR